ncbi:hypothetical protein [Ferruginibacter albus]|uniref:hypothetical protein n=1 Tax=Ferruginibacter albus TaxID=2875540 RepID=UPI001CC5F6C1|nr:hypothetical protein [Ferruginibacter albus]UAY52760.1 hypothetical protein K9M53_03510 [Ferruginibacter albus]
MKKLLLTAIAITTLSIVTHAQDAPSNGMSKEQKAQMKAKKEQDLNDAIKELGLTDDQATQVKTVLQDAMQKSKAIKDDTSLSDADKATKKDEINNEKNDKLKQIMGADKFKQWSAIRKRQKDQGGTSTPN